jgi:hypothetical protein
MPADYHMHGNYYSAGRIYEGQNPFLRPGGEPGEFVWQFPNRANWDTFNPNSFSGPDIQGAWALADDFGTHYTRYLGTPSGSIRWMTAQTTAAGRGLDQGIMFPPGTAVPR